MSLKSIASAVRGWSRERGAGFDGSGLPDGSRLPDRTGPLDAIAAAWPALVGGDVARHCAPLELAGSTLIVATRSSAWSQQLQFLEARVLAGVRAIPSAAHVDKLRFRSGGFAPRARAVAFGRTAAVRTIAAEAPYAPARDLEDALARLRARFAARPAAGVRCVRCGAGLRERPERAIRCAPCDEAALHERLDAAQRVLYDTPWIGRDAVLDGVPGLTHDEYDRARRTLLGRWWVSLERARRAKKLSRDRSERRIATSYVILQSRLAPDRISPAVIANVLGDELAKLLFGDAPDGLAPPPVPPPAPPRAESR